MTPTFSNISKYHKLSITHNKYSSFQIPTELHIYNMFTNAENKIKWLERLHEKEKRVEYLGGIQKKSTLKKIKTFI